MAWEWLDLQNIVRIRRMEACQWELVLQSHRQHDVDPASDAVWSVVNGNLDRSRRQWLRARASPISETMGPSTSVDVRALQVSSNDDRIPAEQHVALSLSHLLIR